MARLVLALIAGALLVGGVEAGVVEQHLQLGPVAIRLGAAETVVVAELRKHFSVRAIEGGWSVQPRARDPKAPGVGIGTKAGRVERVSFVWGPGITPTLEDMVEQLSYALPPEAKCRIGNVTRPQEGGTVRRLAFTCEGFAVDLVTGVWPQGNTASIHLETK